MQKKQREPPKGMDALIDAVIDATEKRSKCPFCGNPILKPMGDAIRTAISRTEQGREQ